jgi:hypothetical protein
MSTNGRFQRTGRLSFGLGDIRALSAVDTQGLPGGRYFINFVGMSVPMAIVPYRTTRAPQDFQQALRCKVDPSSAG